MLTRWKLDGVSNDDSEPKKKKKIAKSAKQILHVRKLQLERLPLTDVRFGRQVEDHIDVFCVEDVVYQPRVTYISLLRKGGDCWKLNIYNRGQKCIFMIY